MTDWRARILSSDADITRLLERVKTVAVLGIKPASRASAPAHYVPRYAQRSGLRVIPVPVYYPDETTMLGERVYRSVSEIPERVDLVNVFRRSEVVAGHLEDLLAARPGAVWMQSGIRDDVVAERLAEAGMEVVMDRCLMVELEARGR
jgi:predicted CoA-binding protein